MRSYLLLCVAACATWPGVSSAGADDLRRVPEKYLPLPGVYRLERVFSSGQPEFERYQEISWKDREVHLEKTKTGYLLRSMHNGKPVFQISLTPDNKSWHGYYDGGVIDNLYWTENRITSRIKSIGIYYCYTGGVKLTYEGPLPKDTTYLLETKVPEKDLPLPGVYRFSDQSGFLDLRSSWENAHWLDSWKERQREVHLDKTERGYLFQLFHKGKLQYEMPLDKDSKQWGWVIPKKGLQLEVFNVFRDLGEWNYPRRNRTLCFYFPQHGIVTFEHVRSFPASKRDRPAPIPASLPRAKPLPAPKMLSRKRVDAFGMTASRSGTRLMGRQRANVIKMWDFSTGHLKFLTAIQSKGNNEMESIALSPAAKTLAVSRSYQGFPEIGVTNPPPEIQIWDVKTGKLNITLPRGGLRVLYASEDTLLAANLSTVTVWDLATKTVKASLDLAKAEEGTEVRCWALSPDGKQLAVCYNYEVVQIWDLRTGKALLRIDKVGRQTCCHYSPDSKMLAIASTDEVQFRDVKTGRQLFIIKGIADFSNFSLHPNGRWLAARTSRLNLGIWDARTGKKLITFGKPGNYQRTVRFSPDGKTLASIEDDDCVLWDTSNLR